MVKSLSFLILLSFYGFRLSHSSQLELIQDKDGLIQLSFIDNLDNLNTWSILKSNSTLHTYHYDEESQIIAFVTRNEQLSSSGFYDASDLNHLSFKFIRLDQKTENIEFLYQTSFTIDQKVNPENLNFTSVNTFQIDTYGDKGKVTFNFNNGEVTFLSEETLVTKEMVRLNLRVDSNGNSQHKQLDQVLWNSVSTAELLLK